MTRITRAQIALGLVAAAALVLAATAAARTQARTASPIVIGWAFDSKGAMAPFDGPALAAAQLRVKQINAKGGVGGRPLQINTCDTQGNKPAIAKACATKLLGQGANIIFTTCDVDFAAPSCRSRSTPASSRSHRASAPTRWGRSASARRASSPSASATSHRTRARRWPSSPGTRAGGRPRSRPTPSSSTSRTSPRRSRRAGSSSAARSSPTRRTSRSAARTSRTRSAA